MAEENSKGKIIHELFEATVSVKGILGAVDLIIGFLFLFIDDEYIRNVMISLITHKPISYFGNTVVSFMMRGANGFTDATRYFIAIYFLSYGLVNLFLIFSLLRGKLWAYPCAIVFFAGFTIYLFCRFFIHGSVMVLTFAIYDAILVVMTWLEYKRITEIPKILKKIDN